MACQQLSRTDEARDSLSKARTSLEELDQMVGKNKQSNAGFQADVAPILKRHCIDCHGLGMLLADLCSDQRQSAIVEGRDRDLIVPGIHAMKLYGPPGLKAAFDERIAKGREWLIIAIPASNTDHAFRLYGLSWSGATREAIQSQSAVLLSQQRDDGGWAQLDELDSDAYATGLTLYALHHAGGVAASERHYQRGVDYLLKTQLPDGSWHVKSRSFPFQPYFESGFPHGPDQWISASATGFAAAALIDSAPPLATPAQ